MEEPAKVYYLEDYMKDKRDKSLESKVVQGGATKAIEVSVVVETNVWDIKNLIKRRAWRKKDLCAFMMALNLSGTGALAYGVYSGVDAAFKIGLAAFGGGLFLYVRERVNDYLFKGMEKYRRY